MTINTFNKLNVALNEVGNSDLIRLVYISTISKKAKTDPMLFSYIRTHSEDYNRKNNIKGMLCNNQSYFLQALEGTKQALLPLMERIFNDTKHTKLKIIQLKPIDKYFFDDWRMRSLNLDDRLWMRGSIQSNSAELIKFLPFRPLEWSEWFLEHFLETMKEFDRVNEDYDENFGSYNIVQDTSLQVANILDSTLLHRFLLAMVLILIVIILKVNAFF